MQQPAELKECEGVPIVEMFGDFDLANMAVPQAIASALAFKHQAAAGSGS